MINMTVIRFKDILRYLVGITLLLTIVMTLTRYFSNIDIKKQETNLKSEIDSNAKKIKENSMIMCMDETIISIGNENKISKENASESKTKEFLKVGLGMIDAIQEKDVSKLEEEEPNNEIKEEEILNNTENTILQEAKTNVSTEVIDNSQINTKFTNTYGSVKIKNESKYELTEEILKPDIELSNKKDIILFHTHTCESYTKSEKYNYEPTGTYRTTDLNFTVARVGTELGNYLKLYGYNIIHDQSYHDYPAYTGSYNRSLATVTNNIAANPNTEIVFDIHRDAVGANSNYAPTVKIGDEYAAQIMFVIGTDGGGLTHPNWKQNLKFAIKIQEKANELYPGLFKPIILRNSRYNQHVTKAASIIEVGATGNTLEQCLVSMKYFAKVVDEAIK